MCQWHPLWTWFHLLSHLGLHKRGWHGGYSLHSDHLWFFGLSLSSFQHCFELMSGGEAQLVLRNGKKSTVFLQSNKCLLYTKKGEKKPIYRHAYLKWAPDVVWINKKGFGDGRDIWRGCSAYHLPTSKCVAFFHTCSMYKQPTITDCKVDDTGARPTPETTHAQNFRKNRMRFDCWNIALVCDNKYSYALNLQVFSKFTKYFET